MRLLVPNAITIVAILAGYISILQTIREAYLSAAGFILAAAVLDMFDGYVARMMNATSEFGEQFDSLADVVNYGLAPALLFYTLYFVDWGIPGMILSFLPVCCAAIRLARFNVTADPDIPTKSFIGLPTTFAAVVLAGFVIFSDGFVALPNLDHEAAVLVVAVALLMVSNVQYEKSNILSIRYILKTRRIITAGTIVVSMILFPKTAFFAWGLLYILYGVTRSAIYTFLRGDDDVIEAEIDEKGGIS